MRLFIASKATIDEYTRIKERFERSIDGRWVEEKNLHLTWYFIGESETPDRYIRVIDTLPIPEKETPLSGLGIFERRKNHILYASIPRLSDEWKDTLEKLQIYSNRKFTPHVTLCRIKKIYDKKMLYDSIRHYSGKRIGKIANGISLIESHLHKNGVEYETIYEKVI